MQIPRRLGRLALATALALWPALAGAAAFTATDNMQIRRLSDPQVSPNGAQVVFVQAEVDLEKNAKQSDLWVVPTAGGEPRQLTRHPGSETHPRWSPAPSAEAMVRPERDSPGNTAAPWARPMTAACRQVVPLSPRSPPGIHLVRPTTIPVTTRANPTQTGLTKADSARFLTGNATTAVAMVPRTNSPSRRCPAAEVSHRPISRRSCHTTAAAVPT